jgi:hypothetical protein
VIFGSQLFFSHIISFRYLHPFPPLVLMLAAVVGRGCARASIERSCFEDAIARRPSLRDVRPTARAS